MIDALCMYIMYLYIIRISILYLVDHVLVGYSDAEVDIWTDIAVICFLHLHYVVIFLITKDFSEIKAYIMLNLTTVYVVDSMSIANMFKNYANIRSSQFTWYLIAFCIWNTTWFIASWILYKYGEANSVNTRPHPTYNEPVSQIDIDKINYIVYQPYHSLENQTCSICIVDYESDDIVSVLPIWRHTFHQEWVTEWLKRHRTWPFCRRVISKIDIENEHKENFDDIIKLVRTSPVPVHTDEGLT
jgi:hypothetical protein